MAIRSIAILSLAALTACASVQPSNSTFSSSSTDADIVLNIQADGVPLTSHTNFSLAPLTPQAGASQPANVLANIAITGMIQSIDSSNADQVNSTTFAYINCDSDPSAVAETVTGKSPKAIIFYSLFSQVCNLTDSDPASYTTLYSMTMKSESNALLTTIGANGSPPNAIRGQISSSATTNDNNDGGPAPTTAVAMSILYSITGIITLLFLVIIGTGAIRAHRHPERYGPRSGVAGRPRQSRAKGLARAMLETLPIVKFGDPEQEKATTHDIEMDRPRSENNAEGPAQEGRSNEAMTKVATAAITEAAMTPPMQSGGETSMAKPTQNEEHLGCSICTEDFTTGEDVRVLPCQHKYHPACIDPWLLNVSGTCPLCRHDLRPALSGSNTGDEGATSSASPDDDGLAPPLTDAQVGEASGDLGEPSSRHRRSRFMDLYRLRQASPSERIAALRRLREQSQQEGAMLDESEDRRRSRLTIRLRDTFRARPRSQVDPGQVEHEEGREG